MKRTGLKVPGADVVALRVKHGYKRAEFAKLIGVSPRTMEGWERRGVPVAAVKLLKIAIVMEKMGELGLLEPWSGTYAKLAREIQEILDD